MNIYKKIFSLQASYIVIFLSLLLWAFFAYNTMIELIDVQKKYSKLINISGKQRMLSQKTLLIAKNISINKTDDSIEELQEYSKQMRDDHLYLTKNITSDTIASYYFEQPNNINKEVLAYFDMLKKYENEQTTQLLQSIEKSSYALLPKLNSVVFAFEEESNQQIERLKKREYYILLGTILTLLIEAFIIAIPALRMVKRSQRRLKEVNDTLEFKVNEQTQSLQEEKNLISLYLNNINAFVLALDRYGKIIMINKTGCDIVSCKSDNLIGKSWFDIPSMQLNHSSIFKENFEKVLLDETVDNMLFEDELIFDNEQRILIKWSHSKLIINNTVVGVLASGLDITKEKKQENIINQQSRNAALGEMIANIAHQWRQPLSIITTTATGLKLQKELQMLDDEFFNRGCDNINEQAQYLSKTIDDFRNFVKGELSLKVFEVDDNINQFLSLVKATIDNYYINIVLTIREHPIIRSYPGQLQQCFINIFNNAKDELKNIPEEDRYFFIETDFTDNKVIITFKDSAGGIPEEVMPKIFDPYFTTKLNSNGTGLGLSMTYDIITNGLGGVIYAQNVEYEYDNKNLKGAKFTIELPLNN